MIFQMNSKLLKPLMNSKKKPLIFYYLNVLLKRWKTIIFKNKTPCTCISIGNHIFWRAIWVRLPDSIFKNFQESRGWFIPNIARTKHVTKPRNTLYWNEHLLTTGNYKSPIGKLQNNVYKTCFAGSKSLEVFSCSSHRSSILRLNWKS